MVDNGSWVKQLVAGQSADGRLEVLYIGADDKIFIIWQDTPNGSWNSSYVVEMAVG